MRALKLHTKTRNGTVATRPPEPLRTRRRKPPPSPLNGALPWPETRRRASGQKQSEHSTPQRRVIFAIPDDEDQRRELKQSLTRHHHLGRRKDLEIKTQIRRSPTLKSRLLPQHQPPPPRSHSRRNSNRRIYTPREDPDYRN